MKGDNFFTIDHLLMVSHAYIPNFRALALLLLVEKLGTEKDREIERYRERKTPETMAT